MKKVEKKSGKQRLKNAELGTENHGTHDVKPMTEDTEHGTLLPGGSISHKSAVSCLAFCLRRNGNEVAQSHDGSIPISSQRR